MSKHAEQTSSSAKHELLSEASLFIIIIFNVQNAISRVGFWPGQIIPAAVEVTA